jgi:hypothetical protein
VGDVARELPCQCAAGELTVFPDIGKRPACRRKTADE